jgi:hypothetical protein
LGLLPDQSLAGHPELGTQALFSGFNSVKQGHGSETVVPRTKRGDADEAKKKVFEPKDHIMDHKEKAEYYRTKLQEIVSFSPSFDLVSSCELSSTLWMY